MYTQLVKRDKETKKLVIEQRFAFLPGQLTTVDDKQWDELKKQKHIAKCLDTEELIEGSRAKKLGGAAAKEISAVDAAAKAQGAEEAKAKEIK